MGALRDAGLTKRTPRPDVGKPNAVEERGPVTPALGLEGPGGNRFSPKLGTGATTPDVEARPDAK